MKLKSKLNELTASPDNEQLQIDLFEQLQEIRDRKTSDNNLYVEAAVIINECQKSLLDDAAKLKHFEAQRNNIGAAFIGQKLQCSITPFQYLNEREALTAWLTSKIHEEMNEYVDIGCTFKNVKTEISAGMIIVSGTVETCIIS